MLALYRFTNTSLWRHFLDFGDDDDDVEMANDLNIRIPTIQLFDLYNIELSKRVLREHFSARLTALELDGSLRSIDKELFRSFERLNYLSLRLHNLRELFHSSVDNEWLKYLNSHVNVNIQVLKKKRVPSLLLKVSENLFELDLDDYSKSYTYPDEDLCLFRHYKLTRLIFPLFQRDHSFKSFRLSLVCSSIWPGTRSFSTL